MRTIKIPNKLKGKGSPYEQFYAHIGNRLGNQVGKKTNQSAVWVSPKTGKILKNMEYDYLKKKGEDTYPGRLKRVFPWYWLNYSPSEQEGVREGYAVVDEKNYFVEGGKND